MSFTSSGHCQMNGGDRERQTMARVGGLSSSAVRLLSLVDNVERLATPQQRYPSDSDSEGSSFLYKMSDKPSPVKNNRKQYSVSANSLQKERSIWVFILSVLLVCSLLFAMLTVSSVMKRRRLENDGVKIQERLPSVHDDIVGELLPPMDDNTTVSATVDPEGTTLSPDTTVRANTLSVEPNTKPISSAHSAKPMQPKATVKKLIKTNSKVYPTTNAVLKSEIPATSPVATTRKTAASTIATKIELLPSTIQASSYSIALNIDNEETPFVSGEVIVQFTVTDSQKTFTVTIPKSKISHVRCKEISGSDSLSYNRPLKLKYTYSPENSDILSLQFEKALSPSHAYELKMRFELLQVESNTDALDDECPTVEFAAKDFLPGFGSATITSTFKLSVEYPSACTVVSTMPRKNKISLSSARSLSQFEETGKITFDSFGIAFLSLKSIEVKATKGTKIEIFFPSEMDKQQTTFAAQFIPAVIDAMEGILDNEFPLSELSVYPRLPGAIEERVCFGLIGMTQKQLLPESRTWSEIDQEYSAKVVAKAVAKQWLGGSLTIEHGSVLTESLVILVGEKAVETLYPSLREKQLETIRRLGFMDDEVLAFGSSTQMVDRTHYALEMIGSYFGMETILETTKEMLKGSHYSIVQETVFWASLSKKTKTDLSNFASLWVNNEEVPVVSAKRSSTAEIKFSQTGEGSTKTNSDTPSLKLPLATKISYGEASASGETSQKVFLTGNNTAETFTPVANNGWFNVNEDLVGLYQMDYDIDNWLLLISQLQSNYKVFSPSGRAGIIYNAFEMARLQRVDITVALATLCYITKETDYVPIATAIKKLELLDVFNDHVTRKAIKKFELSLLKPTIQRLGWKQVKEYSDRYLQSEALELAINNGAKSIIKGGLDLFEKLTLADAATTFKYLPARLRQQAYNTGIRHGTQDDFDGLWSSFVNMDNDDMKIMFAKALCETQHAANIDKILKYITTSTNTQIKFIMLETLAENNKAARATLNYISANLATYEDLSVEQTNNVLKTLAKSLSTQDDFDKVHNAMTENPHSKSNLSALLKSIKGNMGFVKKNTKIIQKWLQAFSKGLCQIQQWRSIN